MTAHESHYAVALRDHQALTGTVRFRLGMNEAKRAAVQWINHAAAGGASAVINLYAALSNRPDDLGGPSPDPAANPYWSPIRDDTGTPITFAVLPGATVGSDILPLLDLAVFDVLVEIVVTGAYTDFSFWSRNVG